MFKKWLKFKRIKDERDSSTDSSEAAAVQILPPNGVDSTKSSIFDTTTVTSSQQPRIQSSISNTSSIHQALNRIAAATTPRLSLQTTKSPNIPTTTVKRKIGGYCECCKMRYENLKQHLTSLQHENFEKNQTNFKELDSYINATLSFENFLNKLKEKRKEKEEEEEEVVVIVEEAHEKTIVDEDDEKKKNENNKLRVLNDIDRLIFESKSLGEKKSERRRSNAVIKYTELTNKDFNAILVKTPTKSLTSSKTRKSLTVPSDLNLINKSTKRKRKPTVELVEDKKPKIKIKLERNKSNNSWQVSSSSTMLDDERDEIDKKFDNALLELVKECEEEQQQEQQQQQQETLVEDFKSKRPKLLISPPNQIKLPPFQTAFINAVPQPPVLFSAKQLSSLNSQIYAAQQLSKFCIYMAPTPPLPPILPPLYHPAPFYMPPAAPQPTDPLLMKYTKNMDYSRSKNLFDTLVNR